jgi:glycosyltransferase involved in cell wall biosynthesis
MSMGRAIVSTTLGAEGIDVVHDKHVLLADTAADFADAVVALLDDPRRRTRLGSSARRLATDQYSWESSAEQFDVLLEHLGEGRRATEAQTRDVEPPTHVRNAAR